MKKLWFIVGLGFGFVLGSRAGSGPYERLEAKARSVAARPEVQDAVGQIKSAAQDQVDSVAHTVGEQVSDKVGGRSPGAGAGEPQRPPRVATAKVSHTG